MKPKVFILACLIVTTFFLVNQSWATCPEQPYDSGICDTLYVEAYYPDQAVYWPSPFIVRFPIFTTHDVFDPVADSLVGFILPLCYTHSNPAKYCSVSAYWNKIQPTAYPSIFRHFIQGQDTIIHNWMMDLYQQGEGEDWDTKFLSVDGTSHFWLALIATGDDDRLFSEGEKVLLATMTFKLEDTMTICVDSCFWPPVSRLSFGNKIAETYIPRHFMPKCERVGIPNTSIQCPTGDTRHTNGTFQTGHFYAQTDIGYVTEVSIDWVTGLPPGVTDADVVYTIPPEARYVEGYISYTVADHCQSGGPINLWVFNNIINGPVDECWIQIQLTNNAPTLDVPDSLFILADNTIAFPVSASDLDNDSLEMVMNAFWCKSDSLRIPTNPPSFDGENPGLFIWLPTEADTGHWIGSFSAIDVCNARDTHQANIMVSTFLCGDCNEDGIINAGDLICLVNYLFRGGFPPEPPCRMDVNCSGVIDSGDIVLLVNYLYRGGPSPCPFCCAGGFK